MSSETKFNIDENYADNSDISDGAFSARKRKSDDIFDENYTTAEDDTSNEDETADEDTTDEDRDDRISSDGWNWKEEDNRPNVWKYTQTSGVTLATLGQLRQSKSELDIFNIIFDNMFWESIVKGTNRRAEEAANNPEAGRKSGETWLPVDCDEIKVYFALCILMTQFKKARVLMNWSKRAVMETPIFSKTMPAGRFFQINKFFFFSNGEIDRLLQIQPLTDFFNNKFKTAYIIEQDVAVDETVLTFRARTRQFDQLKRKKMDITFFKLRESASGYCYDFKVCTNKSKTNPGTAEFESIAMELLQPVLHRGHTLYLNESYSSPKLFSSLIGNKTNAVGITDYNRRDMPKHFMKARLRKGECRIRSCNGILALKWKDNRVVHVLSTKHESVEMIIPSENRSRTIPKPRCVVEYKRGTIGMERKDGMSACFPVMRNCMKEYQKLFFYVFDLALFNSYVLYKKIKCDNEQQSYGAYRMAVAESLLNEAPLPNHTVQRGRSSNGDTLLRLHAQRWGHFPKHIDPTPLKNFPARVCKVCKKHNKRSETRWECKRCRVALHVPDCFERYHTVEDF